MRTAIRQRTVVVRSGARGSALLALIAVSLGLFVTPTGAGQSAGSATVRSLAAISRNAVSVSLPTTLWRPTSESAAKRGSVVPLGAGRSAANLARLGAASSESPRARGQLPTLWAVLGTDAVLDLRLDLLDAARDLPRPVSGRAGRGMPARAPPAAADHGALHRL